MKNIFTQGAISPAFIADNIKHHQEKTNIGAHEIFLGQVRADVINNETVKAIEYTAYETMANEKWNAERENIFSKYDITCMHVVHSLGNVPIGEVCFFVMVSSAHRVMAREACAYVVDFIKTEMPIWGKEIMENGKAWKVNR